MLVMDESNSKVDFKHSRFFPFLTAIHYFLTCMFTWEWCYRTQAVAPGAWLDYPCKPWWPGSYNATGLKLAFSLLMYKLLKHLLGM